MEDYIENDEEGNIFELISVEYDEKFIHDEYLPKLNILTKCLKEGVFPRRQQESLKI